MPFVCALKLDPGITSHLPQLAADERRSHGTESGRGAVFNLSCRNSGTGRLTVSSSVGHASPAHWRILDGAPDEMERQPAVTSVFDV